MQYISAPSLFLLNQQISDRLCDPVAPPLDNSSTVEQQGLMKYFHYIICTVGDTPDREVMELQAKLIGTLSGTLSGKRMLKKGVLKKVNRKGSMIDAHFYLVRHHFISYTCMLHNVTWLTADLQLTDVFLYTKYGEISRKYTVYSELSVRGMSVCTLLI